KDRSSILGLIIYPTLVWANCNEELTILAKALRPPLVIPENTSIAKAIALPSHTTEQVMPVFRQQDSPSSEHVEVHATWSPLCQSSDTSDSTKAKLKENPLVLVRNPDTGQIEGPFKLVTWGKGYACVSTGAGPRWVAAKNMKPYRVQKQADADPKTGNRNAGTQT
ncbi:hypothetical protein HGM15179_020917, partial [Zosterops borbonicus]